jgi:hypothetical protein
MGVADEAGSLRPVGRWRTVSEKWRIAELTLEPGASVALVARSHGVKPYSYPSVWAPHEDNENFDESVKNVDREFLRWLNKMPYVPKAFGPDAELAPM